MKALKFSVLLLSLVVLTSCAHMNPSIVASPGIDENDHESLVKYYENLAREAKIRLQENKEILEEHEAHPYYYSMRGQDIQSHSTANIRMHEKTLKESLERIALHRKMAMEKQINQENEENASLSSEPLKKTHNKGNLYKSNL